MSKSSKGAVRVLVDEVVENLLPALNAIGFVDDVTFDEGGKWNGSAFVWKLRRPEGKKLLTVLEIVAGGRKGPALLLYGRTIRIDEKTEKPVDFRFLKELAHYPMSLLTEFSDRPNLELKLLRLRHSLPIGLRNAAIPIETLGIWGMRLANTPIFFAWFVLCASFRGIESMFTSSDGKRQKTLISRAVRDMNDMFEDGLPAYLKNNILEIDQQ